MVFRAGIDTMGLRKHALTEESRSSLSVDTDGKVIYERFGVGKRYGKRYAHFIPLLIIKALHFISFSPWLLESGTPTETQRKANSCHVPPLLKPPL
jgi:hypothetical protein